MFHGTSDRASKKIMQNGFKSEYFNHNSMLGKSVYGTRDLSKTITFEEYIEVFQANLGRCVEITKQNHPIQKIWIDLGYSTAHVPDWCNIARREEFCIKKT